MMLSTGLQMISLNEAFRSRGGRFSCSSARYTASFGRLMSSSAGSSPICRPMSGGKERVGRPSRLSGIVHVLIPRFREQGEAATNRAIALARVRASSNVQTRIPRLKPYGRRGFYHVQQYPRAIDIINKRHFSSAVFRSFSKRYSTEPKRRSQCLECNNRRVVPPPQPEHGPSHESRDRGHRLQRAHFGHCLAGDAHSAAHHRITAPMPPRVSVWAGELVGLLRKLA